MRCSSEAGIKASRGMLSLLPASLLNLPFT
jgi:hypothetical protein